MASMEASGVSANLLAFLPPSHKDCAPAERGNCALADRGGGNMAMVEGSSKVGI